jgi:PAS domain-containing protein
MTHIELSLSPLTQSPLAQSPLEAGMTDPLERWAASLVAAEESCLVIDAAGIIVAASRPCARLFGLNQPAELTGRYMLDTKVLYLIDFTAAGNELGESERQKIPPLLALTSGRLARGLMRVRNGEDNRTLDSIATPLRHDGEVVGSLSFFAVV